VLQHYLAKQETQKRARFCFVRVRATQSNSIAAALSTSFRLNYPKSPMQLNALITRFRELYSSAFMSREPKRLKKSSSDRLNSRNALIQRMKNAIFLFLVLPGSTEAQVI